MDQQALQKLKQSLSEAESLGILVGENPSIDEMGAALSLYLSLKTANKKVSIASPTEPIVELSSLVGIDQVRNSLGSSAAGDLVVSFPYKEGEIEKVSYTLENGLLNIVVKAGELGLNFTDDEVKFTHGSAGVPTHLVLVGVPSMAALGNLFNPDEMRDVTMINIDTHPDNQGFGEIVLVNPRLSSVSELMTEILLTSGLPMDVDIAQNLLSGISYATSNFQDPKTSFMAFEMAGELMRLGAVRTMAAMPTGAIPSPRQPARYQNMNTQMDDYGMANAPMPQPMPRPQPRMQQNPQPRMGQQMQRPMPRPQQGMSQQPRMGQNPMNQRPPMPNAMNGQQPRMQQPQQRMPQQQAQPRSRQDEIREELARAAAMQAQGQQYTEEPYNEPQQDHQSNGNGNGQSNGRSQNPPADWLTPKVYKGSSDVNN